MRHKKIVIIGIPSCYGGNTSGCELGPDRLRPFITEYFKNNKIAYRDLGNIPVPHVQCNTLDESRRCFPQVQQVCTNFFNTAKNNIDITKEFPLLIGGDHSITYCYVHWLKSVFLKELGILWFDAHGDFNTPKSSPSGNMHGMPLAMITGSSWGHNNIEPLIQEKNACIIGARDIDEQEKARFAKSQVSVIGTKTLLAIGRSEIADLAFHKVIANTDGYLISFDLDCLDPTIAPGVGTPVPNGLRMPDATYLLEQLDTSSLLSLGIMEFNPTRDQLNKTVESAMKIIKTIIF